MLTVLGGLAEFERQLICARTGEGRECAKARGVHMGRRPGEHEKLWGAFQAAAAASETPKSLAANPGYHFSKMLRKAPSRV